MTRKRKTFTKEFKIEAIRLMEESDSSTSEIAMELGLRRNQLYKWQEELKTKGDKAFTWKGRPGHASQSEVSRLKQANMRLEEENEILKKAAVYFAKELE